MARRALGNAKTAKQAAGLTGTVTLQSAADPQAATLEFQAGRLLVRAPDAAGADVTITADLADPAAKPKLAGAVRHPQLALIAGKLLEPPVRPWEEEADDFCSRALASPACPRPLRIVCTDDGSSRQWGGDGEPAIEIHGPAGELASGLSGSTVLGEQLLEGRVQMVGTLSALSALTRFSIDHTFGEL
jgi:hypothetical protein